jgi:uncharacterized protein (DUF433 family)
MAGEIDAQKVYGELSQLREAIQSIRDRIEFWGQGTRPSTRTEHPHVVCIEGVHGGRPTIRGTGVSVQTIVEQMRLGQLPQQIVEDFDGVLTLAQVHDALSYYYEHEQEIEQHIARNHMFYNDRGETVEVILSYDDYKTFLRFLADYVDWESLPGYLQDAIDHLLAEEARAELGESIPLHEALRETGDLL